MMPSTIPGGRGRLARWGKFGRRALDVATLSVAFALTLSWIGADVRAAEPANADSLLIVDCLLPGQVRRLGTQVTYVTARRAVKTTASDCAIRGGEYTSSDRADYRTAMQIWLPLAKSGDPEAQTYMGEIFEKGLGVAPQYDRAAQWYQRAADQGYARAQLNLGALYEKGLGVPKDRQKAVALFRRASGLEGTDIPYVSGETTAELQALRKERESLTRERENLTRDRDRLRRELDKVRQELEQARKQLEQRNSEGDAARKSLADARRRLEAELASGNQDKLAAVSAELAQRTRDVEASEKEAGALRQRLAALEDQARKLTADSKAMQEDRDRAVGQAQSEAAEARKQLAAMSSQLSKARSALATQQAQAGKRQEEVTALQRQLDEQRKAATRDSGREADLEKALKAREKALADARARSDHLSGKLNSLQKEASRLRAEADAGKQVAAAAPIIEILQPAMPLTRSAGPPTVTVATGDSSLVVGKVAAASGLLALTVNDREVKPNAQGLFRTDVPLSGESTQVNIVAIDTKGQRVTSVFMLARPVAKVAARGTEPLPTVQIPSDIKFGRYYALVIGNNNYRYLPKLETAVNDAKAVAEILKKHYGYSVKLLLNADRYTILSALNDMREKLDDTSNLLIYYAGHGELDRINNRGQWLPVDAEPDSTANWISNVQITDVLNAMNARQVMVIADSCYSGTLTRDAMARLDAKMSPDMRVNWLRTMVTKRSRVVLSSGGVQPVLDSAGGDHSVFAKAFIGVLNANKGILEGEQVYRRVSQRVASVAQAAQVDQLPEYAPIKFAGHEGGDFFFVPETN